MQRTDTELVAGLDVIRQSPRDVGVVEMIVIRPETNQRTVLERCEVSLSEGVQGDNWKRQIAADPDVQVTLMNARCISLLAGSRERWPLAGDQLYLDFDLSEEHLPVGSQLRIGTAILKLTAEPHLGCRKFTERFGLSATQFVNSPDGRALRLRGANARVVVAGRIQQGDAVSKLSASRDPDQSNTL